MTLKGEDGQRISLTKRGSNRLLTENEPCLKHLPPVKLSIKRSKALNMLEESKENVVNGSSAQVKIGKMKATGLG